MRGYRPASGRDGSPNEYAVGPLGDLAVVCGATVGDPVASKSAEALEHYQRGEYDQALQLYRDALLDRPDAPELHFNVGDALFKRGEYDQALREFERVLSAEEKKIQRRPITTWAIASFSSRRLNRPSPRTSRRWS